MFKLLALPLLFLVMAAHADEDLHLACHGVTHRVEGTGSSSTSPVAIQVSVKGAESKLELNGLSCWAGKGNCSLLRLGVSPTRIAAAGDGKLTGSGYSTTIEIDRRSGFMKFSQGKDLLEPQSRPGMPVSENASLVCQGGSKAMF
ncbi:MAG: hypothetical protein F9K36_05925 [Burkholderiaceae bacterium]|nr:MAG: hypothetical protein F9K36_05925 [Burkholderiaceae bacterium]